MSLTLRMDVDTRALERAGPEIQRLLGQVVRKVAFDVEAQAKTRAPVATGALRNSIQTHVTGALSAEVAVGVEYGVFVEMGTTKRAAKPFLEPAVNAVRPGFERAVREVLGRA